MRKILRISWKAGLEFTATIAAVICAIDCVVIPTAVVFMPLFGLPNIVHGLNDQVAALILLSICIPAFLPSFLKHRNWRTLASMALGLTCVFFANFVLPDVDRMLHAGICLLGSICIIKANLDSRRLAKSTCDCHHS
jgi:MerC mercury resistance protein